MVLFASLAGCGDESGSDNGVAGPALNGCTTNGYTDRTATTASRTVFFGGGGDSPGLGYSPRCMVIAAGQTVRFDGAGTGTFSAHPLLPGPVSGTDAGTLPTNPIVRTDTGTAPVDFTFATAGVYPYHCEYHQPGMAGVIVVR